MMNMSSSGTGIPQQFLPNTEYSGKKIKIQTFQQPLTPQTSYTKSANQGQYAAASGSGDTSSLSLMAKLLSLLLQLSKGMDTGKYQQIGKKGGFEQPTMPNQYPGQNGIPIGSKTGTITGKTGMTGTTGKTTKTGFDFANPFAAPGIFRGAFDGSNSQPISAEYAAFDKSGPNTNPGDFVAYYSIFQPSSGGSKIIKKATADPISTTTNQISVTLPDEIAPIENEQPTDTNSTTNTTNITDELDTTNTTNTTDITSSTNTTTSEELPPLDLEDLEL